MKIKIEINAPDWARFMTTDKSGVIELWENEPELWPGAYKSWGDGRWHNKTKGRRKELLQHCSQTCRNWKNSLQKI